MYRLFNTKGTKYKSSGLDYKNLSDTDRVEWLTKEPTMIKRPVIEYKDKILVGFDEEAYKHSF
jgi:arsenate reductase-like glutaredoxin family protein